MLLVTYTDNDTAEFDFSRGDWKSWGWNPATGALIIKRNCHAGCRIEIAAVRIKRVEVSTSDHDRDELMNFTNNHVDVARVE